MIMSSSSQDHMGRNAPQKGNGKKGSGQKSNSSQDRRGRDASHKGDGKKGSGQASNYSKDCRVRDESHKDNGKKGNGQPYKLSMTHVRGSAIHKRVRILTCQIKKKIPVLVNPVGKPIGKNKSLFQGYIGQLTHERISIAYTNWRLVPTETIMAVYDAIMCPEQYDNISCGLFFCRFMRDIVQAGVAEIPISYLSPSPQTYTEEEIFEVIEECVEYLLAFLQLEFTSLSQH